MCQDSQLHNFNFHTRIPQTNVVQQRYCLKLFQTSGLKLKPYLNIQRPLTCSNKLYVVKTQIPYLQQLMEMYTRAV